MGYESARAEAPAGFDADVVNADRIEFENPPVGVVGPSKFYDVKALTATPGATSTPTETVTPTATATLTATPTLTASVTPIHTWTATPPTYVLLPLVMKPVTEYLDAQLKWGPLQCPDPPQANAICDDSCDIYVFVSWDAVPGATGYVVEHDGNPGFSSPQEVYRGTRTYEAWYPDPPDGQHCFRVRAETDTCTTGWSNTACDSCERRDAPTLYPISNPDGDGDYEVRTGPSAGGGSVSSLVCSTVLQEDTSPSFPSPTSYSAQQYTFHFTGKPPGTYYYRARVTCSGCDSSKWSNVESVTVDVPPTSTPTPTATVTLTPAPQYWFTGYVHDDDTGEGIPGVTVKLYRWTGTEWSEINHKTTNEAGLFGLYAPARSGKYAVAEINSVGYDSTRAEAPAGFDAEVIDADRIEFENPPVGVVGPSLFYDARGPTPTPSATPTPTETVTPTASVTPVYTDTPTVAPPTVVHLPLVLKPVVS